MDTSFLAVVALGFINALFCLVIVLRLATQSETEKAHLAEVLERLAELSASPNKHGTVGVHQFERSHERAVQQLQKNEQVRGESVPESTVFGQAPVGMSDI